MNALLVRPTAWLLGAALLFSGCSAEALPSSVSSTAIVLTGARLIDGTGQAPIESATLVINDGRVIADGPSNLVGNPDGAEVIDLSGRTIIPGLINAHAHLNNGDRELSARDQLITQLRLYASYGVTTVQSLGDEGEASIVLRDEQADGRIDGARLFVSGVATPRSVEEARETIDGHADLAHLAGAEMVVRVAPHLGR